MKCVQAALWMMILTMAGVAGCGATNKASSGGAAAPASQQMLPPVLRNGEHASAAPQAPPRAESANGQPPSMPMPPEGAQWTIYCQTVAGADHVARAKRVKDQLISSTRLKDWYVVHQEGQSLLYYGFYRAFNDPAQAGESQRAQRDRSAIDKLSDQMGNRPFKHAFFVALDAPDPAAPPEWNLVNAGGAYSLQIAAYTGSPLRKQYAVEAVRAARAQGVEAYYYHGETTSSVCVGAFPESAISREQIITNQDGDPEQSFLRSTEPLPEAFARNLRDTDNKPVRVEQELPKVVDPRLEATMRRFPEHAVNGEVKVVAMTDQATGRTVQKPAASFVVPIPRAAAAASPLSDPAAQLPPPAASDWPPPPSQGGRGKLKSIGD